MHDSVGYYDLKEAMRVGRGLEEHNFKWFEELLTAHTNPALKNSLKLSNGYVEMPEGPGLGVELDWDLIENQTTEVIE
jgi:L-alanine-DL-glutamate epimerase-like enolase superfamily enzyme